MKKLGNRLFCLLLLLISVLGFSQNAEMADTMRSEGKIYVLVSIIAVVLTGLIAYLVYLDRKTARLEEKIRNNKPS